MDCQATILAGRFRSAALLRITGRATFACSQTIRDFALHAIDDGADTVLVDCRSCESMDSTMLGLWVMLARRLSPGHLKLCEPNKKVRDAISGLGLAGILETPPFSDIGDVNWDALNSQESCQILNTDQHRDLVLDAHEALARVAPDNAERFAGVVDLLKRDAQEKASPQGASPQTSE